MPGPDAAAAAAAIRGHELALLDFAAAQHASELPPLVEIELHGDRARVLESLGELDAALAQYREVIERLERTIAGRDAPRKTDPGVPRLTRSRSRRG